MPQQGPPAQLPGEARAAYHGLNAETGRAGSYGALLRVARHINNMANLSHLPAVLTAAAYSDDPRQVQDVIHILRAVRAMSGAPLMMEAGRAGTQVMARAPDKRMAAQEIARPVGGEAVVQLLPYLSAAASALR